MTATADLVIERGWYWRQYIAGSPVHGVQLVQVAPCEELYPERPPYPGHLTCKSANTIWRLDMTGKGGWIRVATEREVGAYLGLIALRDQIQGLRHRKVFGDGPELASARWAREQAFQEAEALLKKHLADILPGEKADD